MLSIYCLAIAAAIITLFRRRDAERRRARRSGVSARLAWETVDDAVVAGDFVPSNLLRANRRSPRARRWS